MDPLSFVDSSSHTLRRRRPYSWRTRDSLPGPTATRARLIKKKPPIFVWSDSDADTLVQAEGTVSLSEFKMDSGSSV